MQLYFFFHPVVALLLSLSLFLSNQRPDVIDSLTIDYRFQNLSLSLLFLPVFAAVNLGCAGLDSVADFLQILSGILQRCSTPLLQGSY